MSPQMRPYTFKEHVDPNEPISRPGTVPPPVPPKDNRKCGMKKRTFYILLGCVLIWVLALALGLGLGLGLGLKKSNNVYVWRAFAIVKFDNADKFQGIPARSTPSVARSQITVSVVLSTQITFPKRAYTMVPALHWPENPGMWASDASSPSTSSITLAISDSCSTPRIRSGLAEPRLRRLLPTRRMHHQSLLLQSPLTVLNMYVISAIETLITVLIVVVPHLLHRQKQHRQAVDKV